MGHCPLQLPGCTRLSFTCDWHTGKWHKEKDPDLSPLPFPVARKSQGLTSYMYPESRYDCGPVHRQVRPPSLFILHDIYLTSVFSFQCGWRREIPSKHEPLGSLTPTAMEYPCCYSCLFLHVLFQGRPSPLGPTLLLLREVGYSLTGKAVPPGHPGPLATHPPSRFWTFSGSSRRF